MHRRNFCWLNVEIAASHCTMVRIIERDLDNSLFVISFCTLALASGVFWRACRKCAAKIWLVCLMCK